MSETFELEKFFWTHYNGKGIYLYIFLGCIFLLILLRKKKKYNFYLFWYCIGGLILYWFPYTAKIIMEQIIGRTVYWRMFWLLPVVFVIGYLLVCCITKIKSNSLVILTTGLILVGLALSGKFVYNGDVFYKSTNYYKLPQTVLGICDAIKEDAEGEKIKAIFPDELVSYVRQYNPSIYLLYGRDAGKDGKTDTMEAAIVYEILNNPEQDRETFEEGIRLSECNYLVVNDSSSISFLAEHIYERIQKIDNYSIYKINERE